MKIEHTHSMFHISYALTENSKKQILYTNNLNEQKKE